MKKIMILMASLALIITLSVSGTIAYKAVKAPEPESEEPTPYIDIVQNIQQRIDPSVLSVSGNLEPQDPADDDRLLVPTPAFNRGAGSVPSPLPGDQYWDAAGSLDRYVTVTNISVAENGGQAAHVRTVFAFENPDNFVETLGHLNYNADTSVGTWEKIGNAKIDGKNFMIYTFTYNDPLSPGETSRPSFKQFALDAVTTNEDVAKLGSKYELRIYSQAVAVIKGTSVEDALGKITVKNHPWVKTTKTSELVAVSE